MSRDLAPQDGPTVPQRALTPRGDRAWVDRVIAGKYKVEGILGRGGMGLVLKARHLRLDEAVAIKVLHASLANEPSMAARMLREARVALRLSSEHIVRVMDVDTLENGVPFMVLEYLDGEDVASLARKRRTPMPWEHAAAILEQTCRALVEAHSLGIIHRDLKPANLFIVARPDGRRVVKLLDFGISKLDVPREAPITVQGDILGSPRYMAPEQVKGGTLDGRSDIWSVGVVLYELLTATAPFSGPNFAVACRRVLEETPPGLRTLRPDVPVGLEAVITRCLEKDREQRFPDAAALRDALAPFGVAVQRGGSQVTLPDFAELIGADEGAGVSAVMTRSGAPGAMSLHGATGPAGISVAPPSGGASLSDPSSASLSTEVPVDDAATTIGVAVRSRRFRWLALGGLTLGLVVGLAALVRARGLKVTQGVVTGGEAPAASPSAVATAAGVATPGVTAAASAVGVVTAAASAEEAPGAAGSAPPVVSSEPARTPWRAPRVGSTAAQGAASAPPDPFGERRQ